MDGKPGLPSQMRQYLEGIGGETSKRAANLTNNMLGFARLKSGEVGLVGPNQALQGMASMLTSSCAWSPPQAGLRPVLANTSQLEAAPSPPAAASAPWTPSSACAAPGPRARTTWSWPWRTTVPAWMRWWCSASSSPSSLPKEPGKGTGLGLSVAFSVVRNHGGELLVDSTPG